MKKLLSIIICAYMIVSCSAAFGQDVGIEFDNYVYSVKVGERTDLSELIFVSGEEGYEIEKLFMVYDETYALIQGDIFVTKTVGNATVTAVYYFTKDGITTDRYATADIRIKKDGNLVKTVDVNYDGVINSEDLSYTLSRYNTSDYKSDFDGDGKVSSKDLSYLLNRYSRKL